MTHPDRLAERLRNLRAFSSYDKSVMTEAADFIESLATPVPGAVSNAMVERAPLEGIDPPGMRYDWHTGCRVPLEAAVQSPPIVGVRATVKPLEWHEDHGVAGLGPYRLWEAETPAGKFSYGTDSEGSCWWCGQYTGIFTVGDEAAAKRQAEAAWEKVALAEASKFLSSLAPVEAVATEPVADEVSIDELRSRAKAYYLEMGWEAGSKLSAHSVIELMAAFGMKAVREPPATCGYPSCGCDHDAVCNVALATPSGDSGALREALVEVLGRWSNGYGFNDDSDEDVALQARADAALSKGEPGK